MAKESDKKKKPHGIEVKVAESLQEDINEGIVRISPEVMSELKIVSGDYVEIFGKNSLVLKAMRSVESEVYSIRLDGTTRSDLATSLGETVLIAKAEEVKEAKSITLSPLQELRLSKESNSYFHSKLLSHPLRQKQTLVIIASSKKLGYTVSKTVPKGAVFVSPSTKVELTEEVYSGDSGKPGVYYEDIGGLKGEIEGIREMVELPMKHPEVFEKLGVGAPKGVLLTGPPGTGKTLLAKAVATETDSAFYSIAGPEIMSKYYGESEKHIREIFEKAEKNSPAIVFIDEIDSIAPKRGEGTDQTEKRIVAQLLTLMDGIKSRGQLVVMAATNRPDDIDPALRRPGRFDRELKINPPAEDGRKEILQIHTRGMPLDSQVDFDEIARKTIGYTGADLEVLCKEAALKSIKPHFEKLKNMEEKVPAEILESIQVSKEHFLASLAHIEPSAMREVLINKPHVKWSDVGGLKEAKEKLRELVELPLIRPDLFETAGIKPSKGVLLTGAPGTGKTLLAKAIATESNANFISVKGPELVSKWVGESEKHVREIFKKARQVAPAIIFFDEFDSISKSRGSSMNDSGEKIVNQLLTELDGIEELEKVVIIAATNRPELIDPALTRPGRIDSIIDLKIPDAETRKEIFKVHTRNMPLEKGFKINDFIEKTDSWNGAEIESLSREAGMKAIKRFYKTGSKDSLKITKKDFDVAFNELEKTRKQNVGADAAGGMPDMSNVDMSKLGAGIPEVAKSHEDLIEQTIKNKSGKVGKKDFGKVGKGKKK